ncbi:MAG: flavin reductase family protein [Defluviitaleaceae bacterium]|nr:flavin reductase family protein [Defluviitaleaceae bacterium]MCL2835883.1 flavin reductase family protein [Defluviitaleaceae bacterium]
MFYDKLDEVMRHFAEAGGFLTVENDGLVNTMTISWGFIGHMWSKPHFICVVRPQRHTFGIIEKAQSFTVSIPFGDMREELKICGTQSGRDIDKAGVVSFVPAKAVESPVVAGCARYFECVVRYGDDFKGELLPEAIKGTHYDGDFHHFYIGEIVEVY